MIRALRQYGRVEIKPRLRRIVLHTNTFLTLGASVAVFLVAGRVSVQLVRVSDLSSALLTYAAIALGFTLAGLTIALTLPDRHFAEKLAKTSLPKTKQNSYSDLLFVFSWTAMWHWLLVVGAIALPLARPPDSQVLAGSALAVRLWWASIMFVLTYALLQFLMTLFTISQVGNTYISTLRGELDNQR